MSAHKRRQKPGSLAIVDNLLKRLKKCSSPTVGSCAARESLDLDFSFELLQRWVLEEKRRLEERYGIRILLVVERSSRVWGTSHPTSDFDMKALFVRDSPRHYYSLKHTRTQTRGGNAVSKMFKLRYGLRAAAERSDGVLPKWLLGDCEDIELTLMDLTLVGDSIVDNDPNVFEILSSPIVYHLDGDCLRQVQELRVCANELYNWQSLCAHYDSWAHANFKVLLRAKKKRTNEKPLKALFYIWRGIMSALWIATNRRCDGLPLSIPQLVEQCQAIVDAMDSKCAAAEDASEQLPVSKETLQLLSRLLTDEIKNGVFVIESDGAKLLKERTQTAFEGIAKLLPERRKKGKGKKKTVAVDQSSVRRLQRTIFDVIEMSS